ncbi:MAG: iron-containing alcohol dehydrogenase [Bacteroidales bacterium]|nr:iron-containing alcohol dehydrogenase [Bacteroidales bacterium]MDY6426631.1 iron-containing alcohol dehydrogenase [Bacteroidales bacterium]
MDTYQFRKQIHRLPGKVIHAIPLPEPEVTEGLGARSGIGAICKKYGYRNVMLVTDKTLSSLEFDKAIVQSLKDADVECSVFSDINSEPNIPIIDAGRKMALDCRAEAIVALGGGSVMDSCKMIAAGVKMPHIPTGMLLLKFLPVPGGSLPLIMVPSTAGTGAELTVAAVVSGKNGVKGSTVLIGLNVVHVVHDSELTLHAPQKVTSACGIDALSHCIEGAVSDVDLNESDMKMSMEGVRLILENLPIVMREPDNNDARLALCRAAMYGGNAINTQLAGYVHAFAHSIGAKYHLSHGQAISLMLMPVLEFQKSACLEKYAALARYCGVCSNSTPDAEAAELFMQAVRNLLSVCGLDKMQLPVRACDHDELISMIVSDSINYSAPVTLSNSDIKSVLEKVTGSSVNDNGYTEAEISEIVAAQRRFFRSGVTLPVKWRIKQLKKLKEAVIAHGDEFVDALTKDLGRSPAEAYLCDVGPIIVEINEMIDGLRKWSRPEWHFSGLMCFPSIITKVYKMPYGVSLVISPFNFPILLTIGVVAAAMCGGNTVVIKSSSKSAASTKVLKRFFAEVFPPEYVTLIDGGHDVADMCLAQRFDKIFYTGSPSVGKHVLAEAAKNLTPVALELGGETGNWCVVRKDADLKDAARKIAFFKLLNAGQICININQIAVAEEVAEKFLDELKRAFISQIGEHAENNPEYPKLITKAAYNKCAGLADEYRERIVFGGTGDADSLKYAPTIIYPVDINEHIVQHELFCPLLPVVSFKDAEVDSLMDTIADREHPLAMYLFTKDISWAERVMQTQQFGGGCINEVCIHMMVKGVPFNGTGHSGMGAYHGEWGFREFTHPQTVLRGSTIFNLPLREHPYTGEAGEKKMKLLRLFER